MSAWCQTLLQLRINVGLFSVCVYVWFPVWLEINTFKMSVDGFDISLGHTDTAFFIGGSLYALSWNMMNYFYLPRN